MCPVSPTRGAHRVVLALVAALLLADSPANAQASLRFPEVFENLTWRPAQFAEPLRAAALVGDLAQAIDALPPHLPKASLRAVVRQPGDLLQVGVKQVPVPDASWWRHFEGTPRLWIDVLEFDRPSAVERVFSQRRQAHSGRTHPSYFIFIAYGRTAGSDVVGAIVRNGRHLFNVGFEVPFAVRDARGGDSEKLRSLNEIVGRFVAVMEALTRQSVAPEALAAVPRGPVTEQERFARGEHGPHRGREIAGGVPSDPG